MTIARTRRGLKNAILAALLMLAMVALSAAITPRTRQVDQMGQMDLAEIIPARFGEWRVDPSRVASVVNPQQDQLINRIYSQTLARTYVGPEGRRIMLSLAYGEDQSRDNQIHKPEVCYPAQGFLVVERRKDEIVFEARPLPVMRVLTQLGSRVEPVTYWIRLGDELVRGAVEQNLARIGYGIQGTIPDGILFRVSEINADNESSYRLQDDFVNALLLALEPRYRAVLIGDRAKLD
ncbi:exosortase-associated protein EpsI, B-type [Denitromonas iodatirespirans]|uniref:EpsI family protein n=1 Tax=Denitromonas iodatirespirans TaxID=2795389 RepID=A0A944DAG7_DENI1|nr:exosortase-associated protein EpsI, B-type [Denitromonas iodatirespirans]MBT0962765.1 EpsI family protein [Denitromonas iodatirespirans]